MSRLSTVSQSSTVRPLAANPATQFDLSSEIDSESEVRKISSFISLRYKRFIFLVLEKQTLLIITVYKYQGGVHYMLRLLVQIEKNAISRVQLFF